MSTEDNSRTGLVPSQSATLSRSPAASLIRRGTRDLIAKAEAEQWLKKGQEFATKRKDEEAFACFERGIELDPRHSELLCLLADAYHMGLGVQEDDVTALTLYLQAAQQGNVEGLLCLGWSYAGGYGVPPDDVEAVKWWRIAAEQGSAEAQELLGYMYEKGAGVPKDLEQAAHWYRQAAGQGLNNLQEANGAGTPANLERARHAKGKGFSRARSINIGASSRRNNYKSQNDLSASALNSILDFGYGRIKQ